MEGDEDDDVEEGDEVVEGGGEEVVEGGGEEVVEGGGEGSGVGVG